MALAVAVTLSLPCTTEADGDTVGASVGFVVSTCTDSETVSVFPAPSSATPMISSAPVPVSSTMRGTGHDTGATPPVHVKVTVTG